MIRHCLFAAAIMAGTLLGSCALVFSDTSSTEARWLVEQGAALIDVRTPGEYRSGHIEGAVNIPVHDLPSRLEALGPKDRPIVVYCHSGVRASRAQRLLRQHGFVAVYNLGQMSHWDGTGALP
jgi:phage shock protein E